MRNAWKRVAAGIAGASGISVAAFRAGALSPTGAVAAVAVGGVTVAGAGLRGALAMMAFFVSSTLLSRLPASQRLDQQRGARRDAVQVVANGGVAAMFALASAVSRDRLRPATVTGFGGAVAAAAADTWATEIGSRALQRPRSAVTLQTVEHGVSGGVTGAGLAASLAGAASIAAIVSVGSPRQGGSARSQAIAVTIGGFSGSLIDSILGASVQQVRYCDGCRQETELHVHHCGARTRSVRGARWCTNDAVNVLGTAAGALTAMAIDALQRGGRRWTPGWYLATRGGTRVQFCSRAVVFPGAIRAGSRPGLAYRHAPGTPAQVDRRHAGPLGGLT